MPLPLLLILPLLIQAIPLATATQSIDPTGFKDAFNVLKEACNKSTSTKGNTPDFESAAGCYLKAMSKIPKKSFFSPDSIKLKCSKEGKSAFDDQAKIDCLERAARDYFARNKYKGTFTDGLTLLQTACDTRPKQAKDTQRMTCLEAGVKAAAKQGGIQSLADFTRTCDDIQNLTTETPSPSEIYACYSAALQDTIKNRHLSYAELAQNVCLKQRDDGLSGGGSVACFQSLTRNTPDPRLRALFVDANKQCAKKTNWEEIIACLTPTVKMLLPKPKAANEPNNSAPEQPGRTVETGAPIH